MHEQPDVHVEAFQITHQVKKALKFPVIHVSSEEGTPLIALSILCNCRVTHDHMLSGRVMSRFL